MTELLGVGDATAAAVASSTRAGNSLLTDPDVGSTWECVRAQLLRYLRARGLSPADADDVVQDVALRALASGVDYLDSDELVAWCIVAARNLHVDALRKARSLASLPDAAASSSYDLATLVEHRLALALVGEHMGQLAEGDRRALLAGRAENGAQTRLESTRLAVQRHRIRKRLRQSLGGLFGAVAALGALLKRPPLAAAPVLACACFLAFAPWQAPTPTSPPIAKPNVTTPLVVHDTSVARELRSRGIEALRGTERTTAPASSSRGPRPHVLVADPDGDHPIYVDQRPRQSDDHIVCVESVPLVGGACVG